jgi:hypothetical protein
MRSQPGLRAQARAPRRAAWPAVSRFTSAANLGRDASRESTAEHAAGWVRQCGQPPTLVVGVTREKKRENRRGDRARRASSRIAATASGEAQKNAVWPPLALANVSGKSCYLRLTGATGDLR